MGRISWCVVVCAVLLLGFSGCANAPRSKDADMEVQGLRNQVSLLEAQIQLRNDEIASLKNTIANDSREKSISAEAAGAELATTGKKTVSAKPSLKNIQLALKNAGYDPGNLDGKMGSKTKLAIKAFQKANKMKADGRVGKNTWSVLSKYLDKQT